MMKNVQKEKITESVQLLFKFEHDKEEFMKAHMPVQEYLIKKIQETSNLTTKTLAKLVNVLKEEKNTAADEHQIREKMSLSKKEQFKLGDKKKPVEQFSDQQWNRNMLRLLQSMSESHCAKINQLSKRHKCIQKCYNDAVKQEQRYKGQMKTILKELSSLFSEMDETVKEENKILVKISQSSKQKQLKPSIYFLSEIKKIENNFLKEVEYFTKRNTKILQFVKNVVKNEKESSKKIKQIMISLCNNNKELYKSNSSSDHLDGIITILEDGVQDSRELYLEKRIVSDEMQKRMEKLVPSEKSKIHQMIKYLGLSYENIEHHIGVKTRLKIITTNISFKSFTGISLAQGWIMTSFTPCTAYLTYDHFLALYDLSGNNLKKIHSSSSKVNKISDQNVVFLEQKIKGFFTDSLEQYQLKFQDSDRMEQFILFIENQIK